MTAECSPGLQPIHMATPACPAQTSFKRFEEIEPTEPEIHTRPLSQVDSSQEVLLLSLLLLSLKLSKALANTGPLLFVG